MKNIVIMVVALTMLVVYSIANINPNTTLVEDHIIEYIYLEETLTYEQVEEEINQLAQLLIQTHPVLKEDQTRASEVSAALYGILEHHQEGIKKLDYYFEIQKVLATLSDGHTSAWMPVVFDRVPYKIEINEDKVEIVEGGYDGYVITFINGAPIETLLPSIRKHIPADTESFQTYLLEDYLLRREYVQYFTGSTLPEVVLTLEKDGEAIEVTTSYDKVTVSSEEMAVYNFEVDKKNKIGWMDLNRILISEEFNDDVSAFFGEVVKEEVEVLVIDLRGNPGGHIEAGLEIIRYLGVEEINFYEDAYFNTEVVAVNLSAISFDGDVYCLIDNGTYSSAANFATLLKLNNLAILVGDETGGSPNHYGYPMELELAHSGIVCTISREYISFDEIEGVQPLEPDITMETFESVILSAIEN